jgi:hypothetical protein
MKASERKGGAPRLKKLIEMMLENLSTKDIFLFRIACGECGREYANKPVRFSKAGITPQTPQKKALFDAVYAQELQSAKLSSIRDAAEHLNYCPICKRLICNRCFLICEDLDMCSQCASILEETGSPVCSDILEEAI